MVEIEMKSESAVIYSTYQIIWYGCVEREGEGEEDDLFHLCNRVCVCLTHLPRYFLVSYY